MHLDVKNCAQSAVARWDSWAPSWHKFFLIPNTSLSIKRSVSQFMFTSSAIILTVNFRSGRTSSPTHAALSPVRVADGHPLRCSTLRRILPPENIFLPAKGVCFWHCIISKGLLKFSMCCGGIVTEFNTKRKDGISLNDVPCFLFMTRFTNTSWHVKHLLHTEALHGHATASEDRGRKKVKGCPC